MAALVALTGLAGCGPPPAPPAPGRPIPADVKPWLVAPAAGTAAEAEALTLHQRLLSSGDGEAIGREAAALAARSPGLAAPQVVLAQARLVAGDFAGAIAAAAAPGAAGGLAARAVEFRAQESLGRLPEAFDVARELEAALPAAAEAVARLAPRVAEILEARVRDALARGAVDAAERDFARLETVRPQAPGNLRLALDLAAARGDLPRELALVRSLSAAAPEDVELQQRQARLEMEVGDPRAGLDLYQALADAAPGDAGRLEDLRRARFRWRVLNAPEPARRAAGRAEVTRADLAVLLYWLVPQVRTAPTGTPRIASDVLDHPEREAIVRVVNVGLLPVDETLHLFEPDRPARRTELLRALLLLLGGVPESCAGGAAAPRAPRETLCEGARACGLVASEADCLGGAAMTGREALETLRRALVLMEGP
jgi:hypothetical protein